MCDPVTATIAIGATIYSAKESSDARSDQRKAQRAQERIRERQVKQEKLAAIRENTILRAQTLNAGASQGVSESSGVQGAVASLDQSIANNLSFINQIDSMSHNVSKLNERANKHAGNAAVGAGVASLALSASDLFPASTTPKVAPTTTTAYSSTTASSLATGGRLS